MQSLILNILNLTNMNLCVFLIYTKIPFEIELPPIYWWLQIELLKSRKWSFTRKNYKSIHQ